MDTIGERVKKRVSEEIFRPSKAWRYTKGKYRRKGKRCGRSRKGIQQADVWNKR